MKHKSYILTSQSVVCHHVFSDLFGLFFLSPCFFSFFQPPSFCVFLNILTVVRYIGLIHLSLLLSSPFLSPFLLSLFFLLYFLSFLPSLPFFTLPANFWCGDRCHIAPLPTGLKVMKFDLVRHCNMLQRILGRPKYCLCLGSPWTFQMTALKSI